MWIKTVQGNFINSDFVKELACFENGDVIAYLNRYDDSDIIYMGESYQDAIEYMHALAVDLNRYSDYPEERYYDPIDEFTLE